VTEIFKSLNWVMQLWIERQWKATILLFCIFHFVQYSFSCSHEVLPEAIIAMKLWCRSCWPCDNIGVFTDLWHVRSSMDTRPPTLSFVSCATIFSTQDQWRQEAKLAVLNKNSDVLHHISTAHRYLKCKCFVDAINIMKLWIIMELIGSTEGRALWCCDVFVWNTIAWRKPSPYHRKESILPPLIILEMYRDCTHTGVDQA